MALAPRGSVRDEIMLEIFRRERNERFAFARMLVGLASDGLKVLPETAQAHLDLYLLELSQDVYRPEVHKALHRARVARRRREQGEQQMLSKVAKMTATDAEVPPPPKPTGGRGRRRK